MRNTKRIAKPGKNSAHKKQRTEDSGSETNDFGSSPNSEAVDIETDEEEDEMTSSLIAQNEASKFGQKGSFAAKREAKRLIIVLENACLETIKVGSSYELLNCDRHKQQIIKYKKDPSNCRPDILHQCLLMLFDSPLNRASLLQVNNDLRLSRLIFF